jgi:hypothetical protein
LLATNFIVEGLGVISAYTVTGTFMCLCFEQNYVKVPRVMV